MTVSLVKGGNLSLTNASPGLKTILIGLGWEARGTAGAAFDLDASCFLLKSDGKVKSDDGFVFYNNLKSSCGSVEHTGDNRTGAGEGDDEEIKVNLAAVAEEITRLTILVTIHDAQARGQNFGQVAQAYIRVVDTESNRELARFDLSEDYSTETAMVFGEIYRHEGGWKFKAVGQGHAGSLTTIVTNYGIGVA